MKRWLVWLPFLIVACPPGDVVSRATQSLDPVGLKLLPPGLETELFELADGSVIAAVGTDPQQPESRVQKWTRENGALELWHGPRQLTISERELAPAMREGPPRRVRYWLGTDGLGRDLSARLWVGGRTSLFVGLAALLIATALALIAGIGAAIGGGWLSRLITGLGNTTLALPVLLIALALSALVRPGPVGLAVILGLTGWPAMARLIRTEVRKTILSDRWLAVRSTGCTAVHAIRWYLLPPAVSMAVVAAALRFGPLLLMESSLSFLGFGVAPPSPSWGNILSDGRNVLFQAWWVATIPGLLLGACVMWANVAADRLRTYLEPGR
jgi:ABC-type dipeptide/oligopeptide/nickel transport system permease subunit